MPIRGHGFTASGAAGTGPSSFVSGPSTPRRNRSNLAARNSLGGLETGGACRYFAVNLLEELGRARRVVSGPSSAHALPAAAGSPGVRTTVTFSANPNAVVLCEKTQHIQLRGFGDRVLRHATAFASREAVTAESSAARSATSLSPGSPCPVTVIRSVGCDVHDTGNVGHIGQLWRSV